MTYIVWAAFRVREHSRIPWPPSATFPFCSPFPPRRGSLTGRAVFPSSDFGHREGQIHVSSKGNPGYTIPQVPGRTSRFLQYKLLKNVSKRLRVTCGFMWHPTCCNLWLSPCLLFESLPFTDLELSGYTESAVKLGPEVTFPCLRRQAHF